MSRPVTLLLLGASLVLAARALADPPDLTALKNLAHCQKTIAREGAKFATRVVKSTLDCTEDVIECQVECDAGVFGPPCDDNPVPGCCDPDNPDPLQNQGFADCMSAAQGVCDSETAKQVLFETSKQDKIIAACDALTQEQLCGATTSGLNFATLNAGCQALDPNYTCTLTNLVNCVGGPLERALLDQISATLSPRSSDAVAALNLHSFFPDIPITRKVKGTVPAGKVDVYSFAGQAGDEIIARVNTRDDTGTDTSLLHPVLTLLDATMQPVASTTYRTGGCASAPVCGAKCPIFKRSLPFDGQFFLAVQGATDDGCTGGGYKLILISPNGVVPVLVSDDGNPTF